MIDDLQLVIGDVNHINNHKSNKSTIVNLIFKCPGSLICGSGFFLIAKTFIDPNPENRTSMSDGKCK